MMVSRDIFETACGYVHAGFSVIPIRTDGTKRPDARVLPEGKWKRFQESVPTQDELRRWFGNGCQRGIALVQGAVSGNSELLDFDAPGAYEEFHALCGEHGLPGIIDAMPLVETPSGGRHLLYRCPEATIDGNHQLARCGDRKVKIETRGEGGYALAPGSPPSCHETGREYRFLRHCPVPVITAPERKRLLAVARACNEYVEEKNIHHPTANQAERRLGNVRGFLPGEDFNMRASAAEVLPLLERAGWQVIGERNGVMRLLRPGKVQGGISATFGIGGTNLLYVFSSNAPPFEPDQGYPPFSVFALLEHNGDFHAAARDLASQGFGSHKDSGTAGVARDETESITAGDRKVTIAGTARHSSVIDVRSLADIDPEPVKWLWRGRIAYGKINLMDGDPGSGKTTLAMKIAAAVTTGEPLPDMEGRREPAGVLVISYEDGAADTLRPRLEAAGAALDRVYITDFREVFTYPDGTVDNRPRLPTLPEDLKDLEGIISNKGIRFLIIDPLMAAISEEHNAHSDQHVRRALAPLAAMAERTGLAVLVIRHLNKANTGNALYRGGGSIGIAGAARSVLLVGKDPADDERRVVASVKTNLSIRPPSLSFRMDSVYLESIGADIPRVQWEGESSYDADDLLASHSSEEAAEWADAKDFLADLLSMGPVESETVFTEGKKVGFSASTLKRAKKALGCKSFRAGAFASGGYWMCQLPMQTRNIG